MIIKSEQVPVKEMNDVRGGKGLLHCRMLAEELPGSAVKVLAMLRLAPGATIGLHSHQGEEDFYFCISGSGVVLDNGKEHPFTPGTLQFTPSGGSHGLRNTGTEDLVYLGGLIATPK